MEIELLHYVSLYCCKRPHGDCVVSFLVQLRIKPNYLKLNQMSYDFVQNQSKSKQIFAKRWDYYLTLLVANEQRIFLNESYLDINHAATNVGRRFCKPNKNTIIIIRNCNSKRCRSVLKTAIILKDILSFYHTIEYKWTLLRFKSRNPIIFLHGMHRLSRFKPSVIFLIYYLMII